MVSQTAKIAHNAAMFIQKLVATYHSTDIFINICTIIQSGLKRNPSSFLTL